MADPTIEQLKERNRLIQIEIEFLKEREKAEKKELRNSRERLKAAQELGDARAIAEATQDIEAYTAGLLAQRVELERLNETKKKTISRLKESFKNNKK